MPHSIPDNIVLKFQNNKIIRTGKSNKPFADFKASRERSTMTKKKMRNVDGTYADIDGQWLEKPIQVYRMWYRFLSLALELEKQKVTLVPKMESIKLKTPKKDKWGKLRYYTTKPIRKSIKVTLHN